MTVHNPHDIISRRALAHCTAVDAGEGEAIGLLAMASVVEMSIQSTTIFWRRGRAND
ncbi:hypothetical protein [Thermanaerothrix daxensis]|uniref:hypothetical protein n=1 Tax=Thermanaerothrix daxensis TaxID=869279 RepID=UPI001364D23E|nr:hypothetical protein [Thermanaerothrix daxensis]